MKLARPLLAVALIILGTLAAISLRNASSRATATSAHASVSPQLPVAAPKPIADPAPPNPFVVSAPATEARTSTAGDGLWAAANGIPQGTILMEDRAPTIYQGGRAIRHDRVVRVEGRRYPAVRVIQTVVTSPEHPEGRVVETREMVADQVLVNLEDGISVADLAAATGLPLTLRRKLPGTGTAVIAFPVESPDAPDRVLAAFRASSNPIQSAGPTATLITANARHQALVRYAEPDHLVRIAASPNDPLYANGTLWGMNNTGQNAGTADADVDAPEGWDVRTSAVSNAITQSRASRDTFGFGPNDLVVAVVDTGVRYTHQDLASNMWVNPGEIAGNGIDDDGNGVVDDVHGLNAVANTGDPMDDNMHGTHVAGTIAAVGNNGLGVAGIAWQARIVACKFLAADGSGASSDASESIWYAWEQAGADVISCSWGGSLESTEVTNQIQAAGMNGAIVVMAAGNNGSDLETSPIFPAASQAPNILTVGSSTRTDSASSFSNYSYGWTHVFAPGSDIRSTGIESDASYVDLSGTSMATPMVSGIVALMRAQFPGESYGRIINRLLRSVDRKSAFSGKALTGGRVNYDLAIRSTNSTPFNDSFAEASEMPSSAPRAVRVTNFAATAEPGEPAHAGVAAHRTLWFRWTAPATRNYVLSTRGSAYGSVALGTGAEGDTYSVDSLDTVVAIYTGSTLPTLSPVASNDDYTDPAGTPLVWSRTPFAATAGMTYHFAVGTKASAASNEGLIILSLTEPPVNDLFADARTVDSVPYSNDTTNAGALTELDEPKLQRADVTDTAWLPSDTPAHIRTTLAEVFPSKRGQLEPGGASIWWKWTPSASGEYSVSTDGSSIDTLLGVYTAANAPSPSFPTRGLSLVGQNDDIGLIRMGTSWVYLSSSRIRANFQAGVTYFIQLDTFGAREGAVTLSISQPPTNDHIANATLMDGVAWSAPVNNIGASFEQGEPKHYDEYGGVSVWYKWVAPATQDFQVSMSVATISTAYVVYTATNPSVPRVTELTQVAGIAGSSGSGFRFTATAGQTYFFAVDGLGGKQRPDMRLDLSPTPGAMINDHFSERVRIFGTNARVASATVSASYENSEPEFSGPSTQRSVWWTWRAPASGPATFTTQFSSYNAPLGIYTGFAVGALVEVARNIPPAGLGTSAFGSVTFNAIRGTDYHIMVVGDASYCGTVTLNLSMPLANRLPRITEASLSATTLFSDQPLSLLLTHTVDPEGNPVSVSHQWQSSPDGRVWSDIPGGTTSLLPASDSLAGYFVRCALTPSDATGDGNPFFTEAAQIRRRPVQIALHGRTYSHTPALPLLDPLPAPSRKVIINEFCKGAGTPTSTGTLNGEWYELLVLQDQNMVGWFFTNVFRSIRFRDVPLWQNVPKGTLIVIYNPTSKHALLPSDDLTHTDGNGRIVVSGNDANYFDNGNGFAPSCPKLSGSADTLSNALGTGARIALNRTFTGGIDDISFVSLDVLGADAQYTRIPHLPTTLGGGQAYRYTRNTEDFSESSSNWQLGPADANFATPGAPNTLEQAEWINQLRAPPPRYRLSPSSSLPSGLSLNESTGLISGTVNEPDGGHFRITVERFSTGYTTASQTFDLLVGSEERVFRVNAGRTFELQGNLDLGTATLLAEGALVTNGFGVTQKQSFATWAAARGATGGPENLIIGTGIANLLAFALNLDPANIRPQDLPASELASESGQTFLSLSFRRQKPPHRLIYTVQSSGDLISWSDLDSNALMVGSPLSLDHATERVVVRDSVALAAGQTRRFLRLQVSEALTPPPAPSSSSATLGIGRVDLSWSAVPGATSYTVRRSSASGTGYSDLATGVTSTSYSDTSVATGATYYYIVVPVSFDDGPGTPSMEMPVTTPATWAPATPTGLASSANAAQVALSWNSVANAASYTVLRSTTSGSGYTTLATGVLGTAYNDTTAIIGTTYYYVVSAVNAGGTSAVSNQASGTVVMPVGWWKMNETSGPTAANGGSAGSSQNATLQNTTGVTWGAGRFGNAATLDGVGTNNTTSSYFRASGNLTASGTNSCTITLWVRGSLSSAGWRGLFYDRSGAVQKGIHTNNGQLRIGNWENDNQTASGLFIPDNTWTFVALTVSPTQMRAWLRTASATSFSTWTSATTSFTARQWQRPGIGGDLWNANLAGQIDDVRYYDRTLTESELAAIYANANQ